MSTLESNPGSDPGSDDEESYLHPIVPGSFTISDGLMGPVPEGFAGFLADVEKWAAAGNWPKLKLDIDPDLEEVMATGRGRIDSISGKVVPSE